MHACSARMEYKYVVRKADGAVCYWRPGENAGLELEAAPGATMQVAESWGDVHRKIEVLDGSAAAPTKPALVR